MMMDMYKIFHCGANIYKNFADTADFLKFFE